MQQSRAETIHIIGIDCATNDRKIGMARGVVRRGQLDIAFADVCPKDSDVVSTILGWLKTAETTLIAIDAPLGWPIDLGNELHRHRAGERIATESNQLFRRETDRFVKQRAGKMPLDVGADRIARTAHRALQIVGQLRTATGAAIPLAWSPHLAESVSVIEVYPAATMHVRQWRSTGYKSSEDAAARGVMIERVRMARAGTHTFDNSLVEKNADAFDAAVCLLAASDFLEGIAMPPTNLALAKKEGWIWCIDPEKREEPPDFLYGGS